MKIEATIKIVYDVNPDEYEVSNPFDRESSILGIEQVALFEKVDRIPRFLLPGNAGREISVSTREVK